MPSLSSPTKAPAPRFDLVGCFLRARRSFRRQPLAAVGIVLMCAFILMALLAPLLAPYNPSALDLAHRLRAPTGAHGLGTDELGRDILSRVIWGARLSLTVAVSVVGLSFLLGLIFGGIAGYYGRWFDVTINTFLMNAFLALPGILLAIAFVAFLGPGFLNLILA